MEPFDYTNSILDKKPLVWNEEVETEYPSFFVNKALSQHLDCILYANEINLHSRTLDARLQYDYLFYSIRKIKRKFRKWAKAKSDKGDLTKLIAEYYNVSYQKARIYLDILTTEQLKEINKVMDKGG